MAPLRFTDLLSHPRQFLPAAFIAAHKDLIGSSSAKTGWKQKWRLQKLIFERGSSVLREAGGQASLDLWRCGACGGHPDPGRGSPSRLQHPAPSMSPQDTSLPLGASRRGWAPSGQAPQPENSTKEISQGPSLPLHTQPRRPLAPSSSEMLDHGRLMQQAPVVSFE